MQDHRHFLFIFISVTYHRQNFLQYVESKCRDIIIVVSQISSQCRIMGFTVSSYPDGLVTETDKERDQVLDKKGLNQMKWFWTEVAGVLQCNSSGRGLNYQKFEYGLTVISLHTQHQHTDARSASCFYVL